MYIFISVNMYATRRCTHGVPTVYPYPQYPWLTQPEGRRVRVLMGMGTGQPGITRGLPVGRAYPYQQRAITIQVLESSSTQNPKLSAPTSPLPSSQHRCLQYHIRKHIAHSTTTTTS